MIKGGEGSPYMLFQNTVRVQCGHRQAGARRREGGGGWGEEKSESGREAVRVCV